MLPFTLHLVPQVAYYCLYGRPAAGSNVKVRLADKHFPGLGVEVSLSVWCAGSFVHKLTYMRLECSRMMEL